MPLYDVHCDFCHEKSEILLSRNEELPLCPQCANDALVKETIQVPAPPSFQGAGWAKDGYATTSRSAAPSPSNEG